MNFYLSLLQSSNNLKEHYAIVLGVVLILGNILLWTTKKDFPSMLSFIVVLFNAIIFYMFLALAIPWLINLWWCVAVIVFCLVIVSIFEK